MPYPPYPVTPSPFTWLKGQPLSAPLLRSDVVNALLLLTQPPVFSGSQTGVPLAFTTTGGSNPIVAPGTACTQNQPVTLTGTGNGQYPTGLVTGQVYYAYNPVGDTFGLSTSAGGPQYTGYSSGNGVVATTQLITQNAWTGINLDTEPGAGDPWNGHQTTSNPPYWYGMFPGIYLAEFSFPANFTSGSGAGFSAGLLTQEGTGLPAVVGGQCGPLSGTANRYASASIAKLLQFSVTGTYAGLGNNYVGAAAWTNSAQAITPLALGLYAAQMNLEWVCALTGNSALQVPDNDTWPAPPVPVRATFTNKNIRDTIGFLAGKPVLEAYYAAGGFSLGSQSSLPANGTKIPLDTTYIDNRSAFDTAGTHKYIVPVPGVYDVYGQVPTQALSTTQEVAAGLQVTSANYNGGAAFTIWGPPQAALTSGVNCAPVSRRLRLNAGDLVGLVGWQSDSGSHPATVPAATTSAPWSARIIMIWRGA